MQSSLGLIGDLLGRRPINTSLTAETWMRCYVFHMATAVELLHRSDARYNKFVAASMKFDADWDRGCGKDSWAGAHQVNLRILEVATLNWLSTVGSILTDLALASPGETTPWGGHRFYELDFIGGTPTSPIFFGELKHSISAKAGLKAARKQLRKRMTIAAPRWPDVAGIALCFEMSGEECRAMGRIDEIREMLAARHNPNEIISVIGDGFELMAHLVSDGLLDPSFPEQISDSFRLMKNPLPNLERNSPGFSLAHAFVSNESEPRVN